MSVAPQVLREAAQWLVRLDGGASAAEQQAFRQWLAADPQHLHAVQALQGSLAPLRELPRGPARAALNRALPPSRGRRAAKALLLAAVLGLPLALLLERLPPAYWLADLRTDAGQWRAQALPDGSEVRLDGRSAVDLQFDAHTRTLFLRQGEILVSVAKDASRPFVVQTEHGRIQALGTRFVVEKAEHATRLAMLESSTQVRSAGPTVVVRAGQQVWLNPSGAGVVQPLDGAALEQAWDKHQLLIEDQPLPQVLERLARNRAGYLLFDRQALEHLNVTAVLPADDSDSALRLLARSLPLEVRQYTPWVTRVSLRRP